MVNGRKVAQPVFVLGPPGSGTEILASALKRTEGFHVTLGQRWVVPVVHAFARTPSIARGHPDAAASVLRDAFAQGWQVNAHCCLGCSRQCREASGVPGAGPCVGERSVQRYGDASPNLLYCADSLVDAFGDARLIQVVRDGRDVTAAMAADPEAVAWFRPGFVNLDTESFHPLLGVETAQDRVAWTEASLAGKCAMRWRGSVRLAARLRARLSAEQLVTLRYEDMVRKPADTVRMVSTFIEAGMMPLDVRVTATVMEPGVWRRALTSEQVDEVETLAGEELRRVGYGTT